MITVFKVVVWLNTFSILLYCLLIAKYIFLLHLWLYYINNLLILNLKSSYSYIHFLNVTLKFGIPNYTIYYTYESKMNKFIIGMKNCICDVAFHFKGNTGIGYLSKNNGKLHNVHSIMIYKFLYIENNFGVKMYGKLEI